MGNAVNDIRFIPLGGGQRVGASCYYLGIGGSNIILDAGIGMENGVEFEPDFHFLITSPFLQSMGQIDRVFISHAHMDHVGALLDLMRQAGHAQVYMTEVTRVLSEYQLYDRLFIGNKERDEDVRLAARALLERVACVSFMQTMDFGKYRVSFFPAGHIPGAMMTLFDTGRRRILYTGDYSLHPSLLTEGCMLPENLDLDTVILCGLHAKHPGYVKKADAIFRQAGYALRLAGEYKQSVLCRIPQLSKGIEFLKALNNENEMGVPIYLDESIMKMVVKMERLSVPVLTEHNKSMGLMEPVEPHIYLTSGRGAFPLGRYKSLNVDFSLHEDFQEMKMFLKRLNARQAVLVHCGREYSVFDDHTIEQEMMFEDGCRTQFIFAEEGEIYGL